MHEDEANANSFRHLINGALRQRATQRAGAQEDGSNTCTFDMYSKEVIIMFKQFDTSGGEAGGDGVLDYKELRTGLSQLFHEAGKHKMSNNKFKRLLRILDRDRGGEIDQEEFKEFLIDVEYEWPVAVADVAADEEEETPQNDKEKGEDNDDEQTIDTVVHR